MNKMILLSILVVMLTAIINAQTDSVRLETFYKFMGQEKADVLKESISYFDKFLELNFDSIQQRDDRIIRLLEVLKGDGYSPKFNWKFIPGKNKDLIERYEITGLRKDIWIYGKELIPEDSIVKKYVNDYISNNPVDYKIRERGFEYAEDLLVPIDMDSVAKAKMEAKKIRYNNSTLFRDYSLTMYGFDIYPSTNPLIQKYKEMKFEQGSTRGIRKKIVDEILKFDQNAFSDPYCDIILVMDFFYPLMQINVSSGG